MLGHRVAVRQRPALYILVAAVACIMAQPAHAQQWRGRAFTRIQYVDAQPVRLDSVLIGLVPGTGRERQMGDTLLTCETGATHCFYYRSGSIATTAPVVQDFDINVWGFGVQGLRAYANTRIRTALGDEEFWPRAEDHFDLISGYLELRRPRYQVRLGRDYQASGLGYYGYDGGSVEVRLGSSAPVAFEAYGGWGLDRGLPESVTSGALASLEEFQPRDRNLLFGLRASSRPAPGASIGAIYQREIDTDGSDLASERVGIDAAYAPLRTLSVKGHADYDLATRWWGKAAATVNWTPRPKISLEGRVFRYRPVFSLQTIWAVFSPTPYTGWGGTLGWRPRTDLSLRLEGERRDYADTDAEVFFQVTTERTWRAGAGAGWQPAERWQVDGAYWLNYTVGSALSTGDLRVNFQPTRELSLGVRASAFQQLGEFRVGDGRVLSLGSSIQWESSFGTIWGSIDRYRHDRRSPGAAQVDWTQTRASLGLAFYIGSEPGRAR